MIPLKNSFLFQIWAGSAKNGFVCVWSLKDFELKMRIAVDNCSGYRVFQFVDDTVTRTLVHT